MKLLLWGTVILLAAALVAVLVLVKMAEINEENGKKNAVASFIRPLFVAHRGESRDAPENTLASFRLAAERGDLGMECDVRFTRDKVLVCSHDGNTKRVAGGVEKVIADTPFAELRQVDVSNGKTAYAGEKVPTFAETLTVLRPDMTYYVEIKDKTPGVAEAVLQAVDAAKIDRRQIIVISFHADVIKEYKEKYPDCRALWLACFQENAEKGTYSPTAEEAIAKLREIHADGLDINANMKYLDAAYIQKLHKENFPVAVWTVDEESQARELVARGVDVITSNVAAELRGKFLKTSAGK